MSTPRRALVLVDVQQQYFSGLLEVQYPPHEQSLPQTTAAIDAATDAGVPIVVVQHSAGEGCSCVFPWHARIRPPPGD
ncbi:hypothetical protein [Arthrobacter crusticola]|uniref:hypothetical protein n=1 Tax=Arthrobacter crusticola TaxID=2547960 RepID=UPI00319E0E61